MPSAYRACLCKLPGIILSGPCPVCVNPLSWAASPAAQKPRRTRQSRASTTRGTSPRIPPANKAAPQRAPSAPRVAVCGAQYPRVAFQRCNLHAGHSGWHVAVGGTTWEDAPAPRPSPVLAPMPVLKAGKAPQVVGEDEATDPGAPEFAASAPSLCGKDVDVGIGPMAACALAPRHGGQCSAVAPAAPSAPARQPPPAASPWRLEVQQDGPVADLMWSNIPASGRPTVLALVRGTFDRGDAFKGAYQVAWLASASRFEDRAAELGVLDIRATVDGSTSRRVPANAGDKHRLFELLSECISELGFDPRTEDGAGKPMPNGAALLAEMLG